MSKLTNRHLRVPVMNHQTFNGSNVSGQWEGTDYYTVRSYSHYIIFLYDALKGIWYECNDGYSPTTKRHMSQCRPLNVWIVKRTQDELKTILRTVYLEEEQAFRNAIRDNVVRSINDTANYLIYADWLEEHDQEQEAMAIRETFEETASN